MNEEQKPAEENIIDTDDNSADVPEEEVAVLEASPDEESPEISTDEETPEASTDEETLEASTDEE
jgi:hypothetical protein